MRAPFQDSIIRRTKVTYTPTFRQSERRAWYQRLTPLTWFLCGLSGLVLVATISIGVSQIVNVQNGSELLSERLGTQAQTQTAVAPEVDPVDKQVKQATTKSVKPDVSNATALDKPKAVAAAKAVSAVVPATPVASWANALVQRPDGSLVAPDPVLQTATQDLKIWFDAARTLDVKSYLQTRDQLLENHFTGAALEEMRAVEQTRDTYAMNRAGRLSIEIKGFSKDGFTARAGVTSRSTVNDIFNVKTGKLTKKGVKQPDQLTIMTIRFDEASQHWKIASIDEVVPLQ